MHGFGRGFGDDRPVLAPEVAHADAKFRRVYDAKVGFADLCAEGMGEEGGRGGGTKNGLISY